jgi:hypothetical protein
MKLRLLTIASALSLMAYFLVNMVMCTACLIPGCTVFSVVISFLVLVFTWAFLLFTDSGLD